MSTGGTANSAPRMPSIPRHRLPMLKREHLFYRPFAMRLLFLLLSLSASACQGRNLTYRERERLVEAREQERIGLDEKRKDAILYLSGDPQLNPPPVYLDRPVPPRR